MKSWKLWKTWKSWFEKIKSVNFGKLTLACIFVLTLDSSLYANTNANTLANTNALTDKSKHQYHPKKPQRASKAAKG